jgi:hypothetical protein
MGPRTARAARLGIVIAAITVLLGHICAVPLDVEALTPFDHHSSGGSHGHGSDGDAVHAASCEMARPPVGASFGGVPIASALPRYEVLVQSVARASALPVTPHATSPPLFLVHSALLI